MASFEILGEITNIETIAVGDAIHDIDRLRKKYGVGRWRKVKGFAMIRLAMEASKNQPPQFAICINNTECPASLELHKIYRVLPDDDAAKDGDLRIVDESGEDYLYPKDYFILLNVPIEIAQALDKSFTQNAQL